MAPILSICIPTYNRAGYLQQALDCILSSAYGFEQQIEIVISDNASLDDTQKLIEEQYLQFPNIKYFRNDVNIGGEANFYRVATQAIGKYIWILGDDDRLTLESVKQVLRQLDKGYCLIIVNFSVWVQDFTTIIRPRSIRIPQDQVINDRNQLLRMFGGQLGYLSCSVIEKAKFLNIPYQDFERFASVGASFLYATYWVAAKDCKVLYLSSPLVQNRGDLSMNSSTWNRYFIQGIGQTIEALEGQGYSRNAIRAAENLAVRDYVLPRLALLKARREDVRGLIINLLQYNARAWSFWVLALPLSILPGFGVEIAGKVVRFFRNWRQ
ncbi:MAG: glycosyltransferase family 2 protein [Anaerolineaceae bacterium]|nr:glycosyltransferase family 2 protein [Anaerolineaceae bacterium]